MPSGVDSYRPRTTTPCRQRSWHVIYAGRTHNKLIKPVGPFGRETTTQSHQSICPRKLYIHIACKDEFRRNLRFHSCNALYFYHIPPGHKVEQPIAITLINGGTTVPALRGWRIPFGKHLVSDYGKTVCTRCASQKQKPTPIIETQTDDY